MTKKNHLQWPQWMLWTLLPPGTIQSGKASDRVPLQSPLQCPSQGHAKCPAWLSCQAVNSEGRKAQGRLWLSAEALVMPPLWLSGLAGGCGRFSRQWQTSWSISCLGCQGRKKHLGAAFSQQNIPFLWQSEPGRDYSLWWYLEICSMCHKHGP